ncbi:MAG: hypothetical protein LBE18_06130 [Planctomycetaceae bacterium]|jgi:hypothetical protein|nr:hypothetical protein [Planctomycetaceae bacterium]
MLRNLICILFTTVLILVVVNTVYAEKYKDVQSLLYEFDDGGKVDKTSDRKIDKTNTGKVDKTEGGKVDIRKPIPTYDCPCNPIVFAPIDRGNACRTPVVVYTICHPNVYYPNTCCTPYIPNVRCVPSCVPNIRRRYTNFTIRRCP